MVIFTNNLKKDLILKTFKSKYLISLATLACFSMALSGCKDDNFVINEDSSENSVEVSGEELYLGLRIYNAASIDAGSRASAGPSLDSQGNDYDGSDNKKFNIGLASENAIFTRYSDKKDCPNFLLIFDTTTDNKLEYLLPLFDWNYTGNGDPKENVNNSATSGYSDYYTFYTSAQKHLVPSDIYDRKVLVVLNASSSLKSRLESAVNIEKYDDIVRWTLQSTGKSDDFLYYTDDYIDENDKRQIVNYLTMSSSMVIPMKNMENLPTGASMLTGINDYGPSGMKRGTFSWQQNKADAVASPMFSLFLERLQAKYTLTFIDPNHPEKRLYFAPAGTQGSEVYTPMEHIVFSFEDLKKYNRDISKVSYVNHYERRDPDETTNDPDLVNKTDYVKNFINQGEYKINITGWGINAREKSEYLFKQIDKNATPSYYNGWNLVSYSPYRNFWAEDEKYNTTLYPDQYREAKKVTYSTSSSLSFNDGSIVIDTSIKPWSESNADLNFYTYEELVNRNTHLYSPENTFNNNVFRNKTHAEILEGRDFLRAGSHVIITAQLLIDGMDDPYVYSTQKFTSTGHAANSAGNGAAEHKYYMNGIFWSENAYVEYVGEYLGYWMQKDEETFGHNDGVLYVTNTTDMSNKSIADYTYFIVEPLKMEGSDSYVHIIPNLSAVYAESYLETLTEEQQDDLVCFYALDPDKIGVVDDPYKPITRKTFEIFALSHPEYFAQHYWRGRMYYAIPITHYRDQQKENQKEVYLGKYGAVRNHWYNFTVSSIQKLGTPVDQPDQELIVPNNEHSYDALGVTLSVLPWHIIDEDVDITSQRQPANPDLIDADLYFKANDWYYNGTEHKY